MRRENVINLQDTAGRLGEGGHEVVWTDFLFLGRVQIKLQGFAACIDPLQRNFDGKKCVVSGFLVLSVDFFFTMNRFVGIYGETYPEA